MTDQNNKDAAGSANRSGSDTASAAKISAGSSVGNVGQSPMPGGSSAGSSAGSSGGASGGQSGQSSTLASHTSSPLGGQPTAKTHGKSSQQGDPQGGQAGNRSSGQGGGRSGQSGQGGGQGGESEGMMGQAQERAGEVYEQATEWARGAAGSASSWASDAMESGSEYMGRARRAMPQMRMTGVQRYVAENPVMVGIVGLAAGLLIGALLPRTRRENELFGDWADEVREQGLRYAHEMTQRGREFVDESFSGDDPRFAHHESEFRGGGQGGQGGPAGRGGQGANRH
jgi:ElaB/YqjD/DUF883 family membrane-anchored ribosome-binding protein